MENIKIHILRPKKSFFLSWEVSQENHLGLLFSEYFLFTQQQDLRNEKNCLEKRMRENIFMQYNTILD